MSDSDDMSEDEKKIMDRILNNMSDGKMHLEDIGLIADRDGTFIEDLAKLTLVKMIEFLADKSKRLEIAMAHGEALDGFNTYMRLFLSELLRQWNEINTKMNEIQRRRLLGLKDKEK